MSKIAEYKRLEAEIAAQLAALESLKNNQGLKKEIEFETKLRDLLAEYGYSLKTIIALLDPKPSTSVSTSRGQRKERAVKVYKNPNTGDVVETKGGNHKVLKAWKEKHGSDTVESWLQ